MNQIIDLFCGAGGFSLGARQAGLQSVASIDIDRVLSSSYTNNFPKSNLINANLLELEPADLRAMLGTKRLTAIVGGPPCQGFSVMGRRRAEDPRNTLLKRYFEYVAAFKPRFFFMENVPGLADATNQNALDDAMSLVPTKYRVLKPAVLNAARYGAATFRPRLVVIGYDPDELDRLELADIQAIETEEFSSVRDAISDLPQPSEENEWLPYPTELAPSWYAQQLRRKPANGLGHAEAVAHLQRGAVNGCQATRHSDDVVARFGILQPGQRDTISKYPKLAWEKPALVLRAGTGRDKGSFQAARPIHPEHPRVITVREAARIQGFPDWFQFHPTKWHSHRMIGNSVSPIFAKAILKVIMSKMGAVEKLEAAE